MTIDPLFLAGLVVLALLTVSPGADMALVAKITLEYPGVTFTDYMSLVKVDGEWKIVNKTFHANRQPTRSE